MKENLEKDSKPLPARAVSLWQFHTDESIIGAEIDRRTGGVMAVDAGGNPISYSEDGQTVAERHISQPTLGLAFCSLEGAIVVDGPYGEVTLLEAPAEPRWRARLSMNTVGVASSLVGTFIVGTYTAISRPAMCSPRWRNPYLCPGQCARRLMGLAVGLGHAPVEPREPLMEGAL